MKLFICNSCKLIHHHHNKAKTIKTQNDCFSRVHGLLLTTRWRTLIMYRPVHDVERASGNGYSLIIKLYNNETKIILIIG